VSRKPLALVAGIVAFFAASYFTRQAIDFVRRDQQISKQILEKSWVEQGLGATSLAFNVPWNLQPQDLSLPPQLAKLIQSSVTMSHEADGLHVSAMHMAFVPGTPTSLEGAANGAINNLKTVPGTTNVAGGKHELMLFNGQTPGFEIDARIERQRGVPLQMRGVVFGNGPELYQILMICRADQASGAAIWERIRSSIHVQGTRS